MLDRGRKRFYEIKRPPLSNSMSNSEPLSLIGVINARRQPFGCSLSKAEKLFTSPKIRIVAKVTFCKLKTVIYYLRYLYSVFLFDLFSSA